METYIDEANYLNEHLNSTTPLTINGEVYYFKNLVDMNTDKSIQIESNSTYLKTSPLQKPNDVVTITKVLDLNVFERGKTYVFSVDDCLENAFRDTIETNDTFSNPTNNFLVWRMPGDTIGMSS